MRLLIISRHLAFALDAFNKPGGGDFGLLANDLKLILMGWLVRIFHPTAQN